MNFLVKKERHPICLPIRDPIRDRSGLQLSYEEINLQREKFCFNNAKSVFSLSIFLASLIFIRVPFLPTIDPRASTCPEENPFARKIYERGPLLSNSSKVQIRGENQFSGSGLPNLS